MNAVNPVKSSPDDDPPATEPSMEEILASIRRIIADDQSFPGRVHVDETAPAAPHLPEPGATEAGDAPASVASVTEGETMHVLRTPISERTTSQPSHVGEMDPSDASAAAHAIHAPAEDSSVATPPLPEIAGTGSVAEDLEAALKATISHEPDPVEDPVLPPRETPAAAATETLFSPAIDSSVTTAFNTLAASRLVAQTDELKGLVREMIRPLLKAWIDEHLPDVVERLVTAEIERIGRGGS